MNFRFAKLLALSVVVACSLFLSSCYSYKPGYINSHQFKKKGEVNLGTNFGNNIGAFASYNPIDRLAILADVSTSLSVSSGDNPIERNTIYDRIYYNQDGLVDSTYSYRDYSIGGAVGSYWSYNNKVYHDFYLGFASGSASAIDFPLNFFYPFEEDETRVEAFQAGFNNFYAQSSIKFDLSSAVSLSLDAKMNFLTFNAIEYISSVPKGKQIEEESIEDYFSPDQRIATQLGTTLNFEIDDVRGFAQFQLGVSDGFQNDFFSVRPLSLFVGFSIPLHQYWRSSEN